MAPIKNVNLTPILKSIDSRDPSTVLMAINEADLRLNQKTALLDLIMPIIKTQEVKEETINSLKSYVIEQLSGISAPPEKTSKIISAVFPPAPPDELA
jgi:hypothetical protein